MVRSASRAKALCSNTALSIGIFGCVMNEDLITISGFYLRNFLICAHQEPHATSTSSVQSRSSGNLNHQEFIRKTGKGFFSPTMETFSNPFYSQWRGDASLYDGCDQQFLSGSTGRLGQNLEDVASNMVTEVEGVANVGPGSPTAIRDEVPGFRPIRSELYPYQTRPYREFWDEHYLFIWYYHSQTTLNTAQVTLYLNACFSIAASEGGVQAAINKIETEGRFGFAEFAVCDTKSWADPSFLGMDRYRVFLPRKCLFDNRIVILELRAKLRAAQAVTVSTGLSQSNEEGRNMPDHDSTSAEGDAVFAIDEFLNLGGEMDEDTEEGKDKTKDDDDGDSNDDDDNDDDDDDDDNDHGDDDIEDDDNEHEDEEIDENEDEDEEDENEGREDESEDKENNEDWDEDEFNDWKEDEDDKMVFSQGIDSDAQ
ncbi:MAG: hypothetical protein M1837_004785 [Sclerophora amabilis]|nr:MAG: hypothetical protein M1837_004785 [Sclerophora amabilis]